MSNYLLSKTAPLSVAPLNTLRDYVHMLPFCSSSIKKYSIQKTGLALYDFFLKPIWLITHTFS